MWFFAKSIDGQAVIKSGFRTAWITDAVQKSRDGKKSTFNYSSSVSIVRGKVDHHEVFVENRYLICNSHGGRNVL